MARSTRSLSKVDYFAALYPRGGGEMNLADFRNLAILNDLADLHSQLTNFHAPEQAEKRWQLLQDFLKKHKTFKTHLEFCLRMTPEAATDYMLEEISLEVTGMRLKPAALRFMMKEKYDLHRPRIEAVVGQMLELYAER